MGTSSSLAVFTVCRLAASFESSVLTLSFPALPVE